MIMTNNMNRCGLCGKMFTNEMAVKDHLRACIRKNAPSPVKANDTLRNKSSRERLYIEDVDVIFLQEKDHPWIALYLYRCINNKGQRKEFTSRKLFKNYVKVYE